MEIGADVLTETGDRVWSIHVDSDGCLTVKLVGELLSSVLTLFQSLDV